MTLRDLPERDQAALSEFARRVRGALRGNLLDLRLFGSKARGTATPESDLDVAVVVSTDRRAAEDLILDIAFDVNLAHDVYISPRVLERAVVEDPVWKHTSLLRAISSEGVPL